MSKNVKLTLAIIICFGVSAGLILQNATIHSLETDLIALQAKNHELESTLELSQLITEDLRADLLASATGQSNQMSTISTTLNTQQCEQIGALSSLDLFYLEVQRSIMFDPGRTAIQARVHTDMLYSDFVNQHLRREAEKRLAFRDVLKNQEQQRIELLLDYVFKRTNDAIDPRLLSRAEFNRNVDTELAEVLNQEEQVAFSEYRKTGFPSAIRRDISNRLDKYAGELSEANKAIMAEALSNIKLLELTDLPFEQSLNQQILATQALQDQIQRMEQSQSLVAQRFYFNYTRNLQQLTQTLLAQKAENELN